MTTFSPLIESRESGDWGVDPGSGARVMRLTTGSPWSHNIYGEQPYCSPDGNRVLIGRAIDFLEQSRQLLVADLQTNLLTRVEPDVPTESVAHAGWGEWAYYVMHDGSLRSLSLVTLERREVSGPGTFPVPPDGHLESASADGQWLLGYVRRDGRRLESYLYHLPTGERRVVCDDPLNTNPHGQIEPGAGKRRLYQLIVPGPPSRVPVFVRDLAGGEPVQLPIGGDWSAESSGHMAWVGSTGRVACAVDWRREAKCHDPRHPQGNLLLATPGDRQPTVFPAPEFGFYHVSCSRCGRYFVADDFMDFEANAFVRRGPGPTRIVVGNLATGKCRVLLEDCQVYGIAGSSRFEPDPYLTSDNRYVIYNGSPHGINHVFAAEVPASFLADLE